MSDRPTGRFKFGSACLIVLALIVLALLATRRNRSVGLQQPIQFDDFVFTVVRASEVPAGAAEPKGDAAADRVDYLIRLRVDNRARRVPYSFTGASLAIMDGTGIDAMVRPRAELLPGGNREVPVVHFLSAGESGTYDFLFALPRERRQPRLRITAGVVGDLLEWLVFGRQEIVLP